MHLLLIAALLAQAPVKTIAVLELRNKLDGPEHALVDAAFLTDQVRSGLLEAAPAYRMITRDNILLLLQSNDKTLEECESECEVETGRRLGADDVVTGEILKFGGGYRINLRMHATSDARLLSAAVASGRTPEALEKDLARAVRKLAEPLGGGERVRRDLTTDWLKQTSRLWVEVRASAGLQGGDASSSHFFPGADAHTVNLSLDSAAGLTFGAGVLVGATFLTPPNRDYDQSGWSGLRLGLGGELLRARGRVTEQDAGVTTPGGAPFTYDRQWTDGRLTLHAGGEWSVGAFDAGGEEWRGWEFGFDAAPGLSTHLTDAQPPESNTLGLWAGGEIFATTARVSLSGRKWLHPKAFLSAYYFKYPTGGPVAYGGFNAMAGLALTCE